MSLQEVLPTLGESGTYDLTQDELTCKNCMEKCSTVPGQDNLEELAGV